MLFIHSGSLFLYEMRIIIRKIIVEAGFKPDIIKLNPVPGSGFRVQGSKVTTGTLYSTQPGQAGIED